MTVMRYKNNPLQIPFSQSQPFAHQISPFHGHCRFDSLYYGFRAFAIICKRFSTRDVVSINAVLYRYLRYGLNSPLVINDPDKTNFQTICSFVVSKMQFIADADPFEAVRYDDSFKLFSIDDFVRFSVSLAWWLNGKYDSDWLLFACQAFRSVFCIELDSGINTDAWIVPLGETSKGI